MNKYISEWHSFNRSDISKFAHMTNDAQQIHLDSIVANDYGFDDIIIPGFYTLSLLPSMLKSTNLVKDTLGEPDYGINYGLESVRFIRPILISDNVRASFKIKNSSLQDDGSTQYVFKVKVDIKQPSRTALTAIWRMKIFPKSIDNN